ncbi:MAG: hypothetical protein Q7R83_00755 [bacterium]|nr:hypothetical protein [bacterium]
MNQPTGMFPPPSLPDIAPAVEKENDMGFNNRNLTWEELLERYAKGTPQERIGMVYAVWPTAFLVGSSPPNRTSHSDDAIAFLAKVADAKIGDPSSAVKTAARREIRQIVRGWLPENFSEANIVSLLAFFAHGNNTNCNVFAQDLRNEQGLITSFWKWCPNVSRTNLISATICLGNYTDLIRFEALDAYDTLFSEVVALTPDYATIEHTGDIDFIREALRWNMHRRLRTEEQIKTFLLKAGTCLALHSLRQARVARDSKQH